MNTFNNNDEIEMDFFIKAVVIFVSFVSLGSFFIITSI